MSDPDMAEAVAMALCQNALGGKRCPCAEVGAFRCADAFPGQQARAALSVLEPRIEALERELAEVREAERERCARIAEAEREARTVEAMKGSVLSTGGAGAASRIAAAIRSGDDG